MSRSLSDRSHERKTAIRRRREKKRGEGWRRGRERYAGEMAVRGNSGSGFVFRGKRLYGRVLDYSRHDDDLRTSRLSIP